VRVPRAAVHDDGHADQAYSSADEVVAVGSRAAEDDSQARGPATKPLRFVTCGPCDDVNGAFSIQIR